MIRWEYLCEIVEPGKSWMDVIRKLGRDGWEAWHIDRNTDGWREVYFKRPIRSET